MRALADSSRIRSLSIGSKSKVGRSRAVIVENVAASGRRIRLRMTVRKDQPTLRQSAATPTLRPNHHQIDPKPLPRPTRQRPQERASFAKRPDLPPRPRKRHHGASRGLGTGFKIGETPPNPATKPPKLPKARALPINETYFADGRRRPRQGCGLPMYWTYLRDRGVERIIDRFDSTGLADRFTAVFSPGNRGNRALAQATTDIPDILASRPPS